MNKFLTTVAAMAILTTSCTQKATNEFNYNVDKFADIEVLRYKVPGFEELSLDQKKLIYYHILGAYRLFCKIDLKMRKNTIL